MNEPATTAEPSRRKRLRRQREVLARRQSHLQERAAARPESIASYDRAEASALTTALELFDAEILRETAAIEARAAARAACENGAP